MADYLFPLADRKEVAEETMAFWFDTSGSDFTFEAGQNADYFLIDPPQTDAEGNKRTFSFAASPSHKDRIMLTTRMRNTAFKNVLKTMPLGTKVKVDGPFGSMTLHEDSAKPAVFIAGGIGITPFRSMIEWATEQQLPHKLTLLYSNRTPAATTFREDFEAWAKANPNFTFLPTITEAAGSAWPYATGMIDEQFIRQHITDIMAPVYYTAGPPGLVVAMRKMLMGLGVSKDSIRYESFSGY